LPLHKSTNGGTNWTVATDPFPKNGGGYFYTWCLQADPVRTDNLWAAGDFAGVKVSRDGGVSWSSPAQFFDARFVSSCNGKIAVWGKANGGDNPTLLWYSADDGATWTPQTNTSHNFHGVQGITVDRNGKIWVSWNSATVVTPVTGDVTALESPTFENATSVFPNPTQGIVSLRIESEDTGLHTIAVYNVAGKKLRTTVVSKTTSLLEVSINLTEFPNGIYYIEIGNNNSRSVKKVAKL
jgi:hypothetical protein